MAEPRPWVPFVSVVVPVLDDERRVGLCIEALLAQSYPRDRYEILVVDNGSTDGTRAAIVRHPVALLIEEQRGSYAARNAGIRHARGEVIALTDADCVPAPGWIEEGVDALERQDAGLAGGGVRFFSSPRPSGAEMYDAVSNMQQERNIRERGVAKTANLFVRAKVFAAVGAFPHAMQSGGDVYWTGRATAEGHRLVYAPRAEVAHPTRRLPALLAKQFRVGRGRYDRQLLEAGVTGPAARRLPPPALTLASFGAPAWGPLVVRVRQHDARAPLTRLLRTWGVGWLCRVTTALGSVSRWLDRRVGLDAALAPSARPGDKARP